MTNPRDLKILDRAYIVSPSMILTITDLKFTSERLLEILRRGSPNIKTILLKVSLAPLWRKEHMKETRRYSGMKPIL